MPKETRPIARYALDQPLSSTSIKKTVKSNFFLGAIYTYRILTRLKTKRTAEK